MEAEKSHNLLLSASWRPRKACGEIQSKCKSLRTRSQWCRFQSFWEYQRTRRTESKRRSMFYLSSQAGRAQFFLSPPFCSIRALNRLWDDAHAHWGSKHFIESTDSSADFIQKHITDTLRNNTWASILAPQDPIKLANKINYHNKLNVELLYEWAITFPVFNNKKLKTVIQTKICSRILIQHYSQ